MLYRETNSSELLTSWRECGS